MPSSEIFPIFYTWNQGTVGYKYYQRIMQLPPFPHPVESKPSNRAPVQEGESDEYDKNLKKKYFNYIFLIYNITNFYLELRWERWGIKKEGLPNPLMTNFFGNEIAVNFEKCPILEKNTLFGIFEVILVNRLKTDHRMPKFFAP